MFLLAKSASAATAALGLGGYVLDVAGADGMVWRVVVGVVAALAITAFVSGGIRRSCS